MIKKALIYIFFSVWSAFLAFFPAASEELSRNNPAQTPLFCPQIAGIMPLTASSALLWWDSLDTRTEAIVVERMETEWADFQEDSRVYVPRGWVILTKLHSLRPMKFRLVAIIGSIRVASSSIFNYEHHPTMVDWVFVGEGTAHGHLSNLDPFAKPAPFFMSAWEIPNWLYTLYCREAGIPYPEIPGFTNVEDYFQAYPDHPVVNVNWYEAVNFCHWLSDQGGIPSAYDEQYNLVNQGGIRLPFENEWDFAARLGGKSYPWGEEPPDANRANCELSQSTNLAEGPHTVPVKKFPQSTSGFWNLAGNVWEWCQDWYDENGLQVYQNPLELNSLQVFKVVRGGSWSDPPEMLQNFQRSKLTPSVRLTTVGFRVARSFPKGIAPLRRQELLTEDNSHHEQ